MLHPSAVRASTPTERAELALRLRERRAEIEGAMLARVNAIADPGEVGDPQYAIGLREAVGTAIAYGIAGVEEETVPHSIPEQLLTQARSAARSRVSLDTVLRRYFAGYVLLSDFLAREVDRAGLLDSLRPLLGSEAIVLDRLVAAVSAAYADELGGRGQGFEERRGRYVRMLLAGELVETDQLGYDLDGWHIGAIAMGPGARTAIRELSSALDRQLLAIQAGGGTIWAWLGGRHEVTSREAHRLARSRWPADGVLALGESGQGVEGWRLTHRQARAALPIARRGSNRVLHHAEVALLAAALGDDVLADSLRHTYLVPLKEARNEGAVLRGTLEAYFNAGRRVSSAAAVLGVSRQTVSIRLRSVEERIGRSLDSCVAELETALRLDHLNSTR